MPKLNEKAAKEAAAAEAPTGFDPIPPGVYHARLVDVDGSRSGPKGPYWSWEFDVVEGEHANRKLWNNTSLSSEPFPRAKLKESFEAFGATPEADTDDLVGQVVKLKVSTRVIQEGARKGEIANQIDAVLPKDDDFEAPAAESSSPDSEDIFS